MDNLYEHLMNDQIDMMKDLRSFPPQSPMRVISSRKLKVWRKEVKRKYGKEMLTRLCKPIFK